MQMKRWICVVVWLGVVAVGTMPFDASAGPKVLTPRQMEAVTAAGFLALQFNLAVPTQVAVALPVAVAACAFNCAPSASATAIASNLAFVIQSNRSGP
jgi:hypothetical protein